MPYPIAAELIVSQWLNSDDPLTLSQYRGRVILLEVFQMLCPACVSHGLPQASEVFESFSREQVIVIGLHSVFEHHAAMRPESLAAFVHEYRIRFPVAIDAASPGSRIPQTMARYQLRGTPSQILIDRNGRLRKSHFGAVSDLKLGAELMTLLNEPPNQLGDMTDNSQIGDSDCDATGCRSDEDSDVREFER